MLKQFFKDKVVCPILKITLNYFKNMKLQIKNLPVII